MNTEPKQDLEKSGIYKIYAEMSLDEHIRNSIDEASALHRKRNPYLSNISLDKSLDEHIRDSQLSQKKNKPVSNQGCARFDRRSMRDEDEDEEENYDDVVDKTEPGLMEVDEPIVQLRNYKSSRWQTPPLMGVNYEDERITAFKNKYIRNPPYEMQRPIQKFYSQRPAQKFFSKPSWTQNYDRVDHKGINRSFGQGYNYANGGINRSFGQGYNYANGGINRSFGQGQGNNYANSNGRINRSFGQGQGKNFANSDAGFNRGFGQGQGINYANSNGGINRSYGQGQSNNYANSDGAGQVIKKGSFKYNIDNQVGNGNHGGIVGIERADGNKALAGTASSVNITVNMGGFMEGLFKQVNKAPTVSHSDVAVAAQELLNLLNKHKNKNETQPKLNISIQKKISKIQRRPIVYEDRGDNQVDIEASSGDGIDDFQSGKPHSTKMPMNIRFA